MSDLSKMAANRPLRAIRLVSLWVFALIGFFWVFGGLLLGLIFAPLFVTEVVRKSYSPDRSSLAEVEVRRGGLGTVWTTRIHVGTPTKRRWTVYQTKDSDFVPSLTWLNKNTLLIGLPCSRFDHVSNPDDWESVEPRPNRLRVRFEQPEGC